MNEHLHILFRGCAIGLCVIAFGGLVVGGSPVVNFTLSVLAVIGLLVTGKGNTNE